MDRTGSRRRQSTSGRAGAEGRRRPLSSSSGSSPRSKRHRDQSGSEPNISADTETASGNSSSHTDQQGSMSNDDCVLVSPRTSRFLFAGSRDHPGTRRGNGSGRMGRERRWPASSPIVVPDDDSDEDAVVVEDPPPSGGPSLPRRPRRINRARHPCPPAGVVDILENRRDLLRQLSMPQDGRRRQQERRAPALPPLRTRTIQALSPLVPMGRMSALRRRSGSYSRFTVGGRAQSSRAVERQIAEDEQLARRLQEREMGERRTASHPIHDVLELLDSSSDDDDDSDDDDGVEFMLGYPFGTGRFTHRGRAALPSLFPVVSLLDTLHAPLISHLEFFDSDSEEEEDQYEHLVQLGEALGEVVPQGLTTQQIAQLPTRRVVGSDLASEKRTCHICLEDFKRNNIVRTLPCLHEYHKGCLDKWLKRNSTCPLCRKEALE